MNAGGSSDAPVPCPTTARNHETVTVLITGVAGFIGNHLAHALLEDGVAVIGIDNLSPYYDVALKHARLKRLERFERFTPLVFDLCDGDRLKAAFADASPEIVLHLAAQPGVRYSLEAPEVYVQSNLVGFANLLEACRSHPPRHLIYASSSSVYGANRALPSSEHGHTDHPLTLYAASKKSNEVMAHSYSHLFGLPITGVRFFTVYGEWGRPDMAFFKFTDAILNDRPIQRLQRRQDVARFHLCEGCRRSGRAPDRSCAPRPDHAPGTPNRTGSRRRAAWRRYRVFNVGNASPVPLMTYIDLLQDALGRRARINFTEMQPGEVQDTWADTTDLTALINYAPATPVETGIANFVTWYKTYYGID